jgi:hypothetical protein
MPGYILVNNSCVACSDGCAVCTYDYDNNVTRCSNCNRGLLLFRSIGGSGSTEAECRKSTCPSGTLPNIDSYYSRNKEIIESSEI